MIDQKENYLIFFRVSDDIYLLLLKRNHYYYKNFLDI